jgi:hypothetical protein
VNYLNLIVDPLNQQLAQSRGNATIGVNPIAAKNNTIVTLHLNDEECGRERLAPYGELHRDDAFGLHWVGPHAVKHQVGLHKLIVFPPKLLEDGVRQYVDGSAAVDEHPGERSSVDVTPNVQWLHVLARLLRLLKHDLLGAKTHLSNLLLGTPELDRQREHHVDVHGGGDPSLINGDSTSSSRSMSSSEAVSAGASVFSFILHSCFIEITGRMALKCLSLSFLASSSLSFCALNC